MENQDNRFKYLLTPEVQPEHSLNTNSTNPIRKTIQELEFDRWLQHQLWLTRHLTSSYAVDICTYWEEIGAFVCTLPRRQGKTTTMYEIVHYVINSLHQNAVCIFPNIRMLEDFPRPCPVGVNNYVPMSESYEIIEPLGWINPIHCNLFVDEVSSISDSTMDTLFSKHWKSVSLFGTYRIK